MSVLRIGRNWLAALLLGVGLLGGGAVVASAGPSTAPGIAPQMAQGTPDAAAATEDEECEDEENGDDGAEGRSEDDDAAENGTAEADEDNGDDENGEDATAEAEDNGDDDAAEDDEDNGDAENGDAEATVASGTLDDGADLLPQASITVEQAVAAAQGAAEGAVGEVDLETDNGTLIFTVDIGDQDVKVDATTGAVLAVEPEETDEDDEDGCAEEEETTVAPGTLDDGAELLPQATITIEQAIAAAQGAAEGEVGEVDLEMENGTLVFNVDIGDNDVKVDAATGQVLSVDQDD